MKRGYRNLLIFELVIFIVLFLNSFVSSILSNTKMILFLLIIIISFKFLFRRFEKDRHIYTKDIIFEEIIFLTIFLLLYYLSGIFLSFAKVDNYYTLKSIINIIIPIIITIILKEYLRYQILQKADGKKSLIVFTTILFIFLDLTNAIYMNLNLKIYDKFLFIAITVLPTVSTNIMCSYVSYKTGYKPTIFYRLVVELFMYLLPLIPNPNQYIYSIIWLFVPIVLCHRIYKFFKKEKDEEVLREYHKKKIGTLIIPTVLIIFVVYITCGYFKYYALAIASGSMTPHINKGDIVIVEKSNDYKNIEIGQVIAYKYQNITIVHRLVKKVKGDNQYYFYTKGDANQDVDSYPITEDMVLGIVNIKIPYLGLPTVWLNEK